LSERAKWEARKAKEAKKPSPPSSPANNVVDLVTSEEEEEEEEEESPPALVGEKEEEGQPVEKEEEENPPALVDEEEEEEDDDLNLPIEEIEKRCKYYLSRLSARDFEKFKILIDQELSVWNVPSNAVSILAFEHHLCALYYHRLNRL
jgi:hypothetical protein